MSINTRMRHYVTFESPGTFFSESTSKPIEEWAPTLAVQLASGIEERYGARPYGFRFSTRIEADDVPDGHGGVLKVQPRTCATSGMYFLGGRVLNFDEVPGEQSILRSNMRGNGWAFVVVNTNSYRCTQPFDSADVVVDVQTGAVVERGDAPERVAYRKEFDRRHDPARPVTEAP